MRESVKKSAESRKGNKTTKMNQVSPCEFSF